MTARVVKEERGMTRNPAAVESCAQEPHQVECEVRRRLLSQSDCEIHSLVVHRIDDGVCIEGVVECETPLAKITAAVESIAGVGRVMNRLVHRRPALKG